MPATGAVRTTKAPNKFGPEVRERYLDLLRAGHGRLSACRAVGIHPDTMRRFSRHSEEFRAAVADAEEEAAEPVEAKLYEAATAGEPWAVKEWLSKRATARWGDPAHRVQVDVSGTVEHRLEVGPGTAAGAVAAARVAALVAELEERRDALAAAGALEGRLALPGGTGRQEGQRAGDGHVGASQGILDVTAREAGR